MSLPLHEHISVGDELVRVTVAPLDEVESSSALMPNRPLAPGKQYRFHFDMTKCIGCRSREVACNEQNGNPADLHWRRIGEIEGGVIPIHAVTTFRWAETIVSIRTACADARGAGQRWPMSWSA